MTTETRDDARTFSYPQEGENGSEHTVKGGSPTITIALGLLYFFPTSVACARWRWTPKIRGGSGSKNYDVVFPVFLLAPLTPMRLTIAAPLLLAVWERVMEGIFSTVAFF